MWFVLFVLLHLLDAQKKEVKNELSKENELSLC